MRKKLAAIAIVATVGLAATAAFAAWTASGSGTGTAQAGHSELLTTVAATAATDFLYPSGSADVKVKIHNPNPYPVTVTAINNGTGSIVSGNTACDASHGVTFANQTGTWAVPAGGDAEVTLADAASMSNASVDACQDKVFRIPVALVGASS